MTNFSGNNTVLRGSTESKGVPPELVNPQFAPTLKQSGKIIGATTCTDPCAKPSRVVAGDYGKVETFHFRDGRIPLSKSSIHFTRSLSIGSPTLHNPTPSYRDRWKHRTKLLISRVGGSSSLRLTRSHKKGRTRNGHIIAVGRRRAMMKLSTAYLLIIL
jgi:hypothetical protein